MAKRRNPRRTDDKQIPGVDRIDAPPEEMARALFQQPVKKTE